MQAAYEQFLKTKEFKNEQAGFDPVFVPDFLFDFQKHINEWIVRKGRCAVFADCGLGKTPLSLVWCENILRKESKSRILIVTPIAVSHQFVREGEKFGIKVNRTTGELHKGINTTNYEQLHKFNPNDFMGVVCDESSILKHSDAKTRKFVTDFLKHVKYRLLQTATPAPNDFMELGTSSEALGQMTYNQMLAMFFTHKGDDTGKWVLKGHAKKRFWQWMSTWAIALRRPSDLGCDNGKFKLPSLNICKEEVKTHVKGYLIVPPARTLDEIRQEKRDTLSDRCKRVADVLPKDKPCLCWCHLNDEGDYLEKIIPGAVQVSGSDKDEVKERKLIGFTDGSIRVLITKPRIGGFGMNWQHCSDMTYFPSFSFEQYYQCIRRCWRFGQKNTVNVHVIGSERESNVIASMIKKEKQAEEMYEGIVREMSEFQTNTNHKEIEKEQEMRVPEWL